MSTDLTLQADTTITQDQVSLIKTTVAKGATDTELQLYFYDCKRHGVHPLDKLIHFTKRGGKYTPITSIDLLRSRAADTDELGGIDDATFHGKPMTDDFTASVTVWRLVKGQRCPFTATARWAEYLPSEGFMWKKMPHLMLGKCAEALALRKAFPKQLAGLYAKEEMGQHDSVDLPKQIHHQQPETAESKFATPGQQPPKFAVQEQQTRSTINTSEWTHLRDTLEQHGIKARWFLDKCEVSRPSEITLKQYDDAQSRISQIKKQFDDETNPPAVEEEIPISDADETAYAPAEANHQ